MQESALAVAGEISPHKSLPGAPSEGQELPTNQRDRQAWALDIKLIPGSDRAIFHGEKPHISSHYGSYTLLHDVPIEMRAHQSNVGHDKIHVGRNKILSQFNAHWPKNDPDGDTAWAKQRIEPLRPAHLHGPNNDPDEECCLYGKYCPIRFESFLFEANICKGQFVWELANALAELDRWQSDTEPYSERKQIKGYEVIRVTAPPGLGKSALLRYLDDILKPGSEIEGTRPLEIRGILAAKDDTFYKQHICMIKLDELGAISPSVPRCWTT